MKLKLLLAHTTNRFYLRTGYDLKPVLRYQYSSDDEGFYIGTDSESIFKHLDTPLKKL